MATATKSKRSSSKSEGRVAPCDDKLPKQLGVRLSEAEYEQINARARSQGRTASNLIHRILLGLEKGL